MENKLLEWINKTGYPLEIYAESILSANNFKNENSYIYYDQENNLSRELDILAYKYLDYEPGNNKDNICCDISLLIECKKSTKPFILLQSHSNQSSPYDIYQVINSNDYMCLAILQKDFPHEIPIMEEDKRGFKLVQGFTDSDETIHKAMNTLLKSYSYYNDLTNQNKEDYYSENEYNIIIPILLIDAPFYCLQLDQEENVIITKIENGTLNYSTTLSGFNEPFPILISTKKQFKLCLEAIDLFGKNIIEYLKLNPQYNLRCLPHA